MKTNTAKTLTTAEAKLAASVLRPLIDNGLLPTWLADAVKALGCDREPVQGMTPREAAAVLKVSTRTLRNWHLAGRLPAHKVGLAATRYNRAAIEALLAGDK
jgi:excisionase family DNA binding protein